MDMITLTSNLEENSTRRLRNAAECLEEGTAALVAHTNKPARENYDVVIIGGAIMGSATAWFLTQNPDFDGSILVVERDMKFEFCSTAHTNSCMRQQFSHTLNVQISQYAAHFVKNIRSLMGNDQRVPELHIQNFGYLYLADNDAFANVLRQSQKVQVAAGAGTEVLTRAEIAARYPFYQLDDICLGTINTVDEGYWDGAAVFEWWRRQAREQGAEYVENEVIGINQSARGNSVETVTLASGDVVGCGQLVNAAGPRAAIVAKLAGIELPVEPRKRFSWVFKAERPLEGELPLTIDPSGVHVRENGGGTYQAGGHSDPDEAVDPADFGMDHGLWESHIWPTLATRIPQFEAIKVQAEWTGHYAFNTLDQNAVIGAHPALKNFFFINGFSGHGLQQSPAMGRGLSEFLTYGEYRTLDLTPFHFERVIKGEPIIERAVI